MVTFLLHTHMLLTEHLAHQKEIIAFMLQNTNDDRAYRKQCTIQASNITYEVKDRVNMAPILHFRQR